jgi:hypothetical protein
MAWPRSRRLRARDSGCGRGAHGGHHEDGLLRPRDHDAAKDGDTVDVGQAQVEEHEVVLSRLREREPVETLDGRIHRMAFRPQSPGEKAADAHLVVEDENRAHAASVPAVPALAAL